MKTLLLTVALGATMFSGAAIAQDQGGGRGGRMQDMTRRRPSRWPTGCSSASISITMGRSPVRKPSRPRRSWRAGDRAQRMIDRVFGTAQSLTLQQFEAQQLARFDRDDLNHDGTVTAAERQQARSAFKAERAAAGPAAGSVNAPLRVH